MSKAYNQVVNLAPHKFPSKMNLPVQVINLNHDVTPYTNVENYDMMINYDYHYDKWFFYYLKTPPWGKSSLNPLSI